MASLIGRARRKLLERLSQAERLMAMPVFVAGTTFLSPVVDGEMCCVSEPWMVAHADMKQSDYVFCPASDVKALAAAVPVLAA